MHVTFAAVAFALGLAVGAEVTSVSSETASRVEHVTQVIVDTDAGQDDLMAIAFLLSSPSVRVEAVCIGTGLAHVPAGAANILQLLDLAGRRDVRVYAGRSTPLAGGRHFPDDWRRSANELPGVALRATARQPESQPAAEFLAARLSDRHRPVEVLALGGLTNLAEAFAINPAAAKAVRRIVMMGGALHVPGNLGDGGITSNTTAEWNFYVDPEATRRVFTSGAPIRVIPLDATRHVRIDRAFVEAVDSIEGSGLAKVVGQVLATVRKWIDEGIYYAWDPLAAAALVDPSVVQFKRLAVEIRVEPPEDGRMILVLGARPNAEIALDADAARFRQLFLRTLGRAVGP